MQILSFKLVFLELSINFMQFFQCDSNIVNKVPFLITTQNPIYLSQQFIKAIAANAIKSL